MTTRNNNPYKKVRVLADNKVTAHKAKDRSNSRRNKLIPITKEEAEKLRNKPKKKP